ENLIGTDALIGVQDGSSGITRYAGFDGERLLGAIFLGPAPVAVPRRWAADLLNVPFTTANSRLGVLAARPGGETADPGATICACFGVGTNQIAGAVRKGCTTVESVGQTLQAGTNCGSCRAEIARIIGHETIPMREVEDDAEGRIPQAV
ncbi:MAG: (2Fe-2S)-binding protein, partial [Pseudomonadota bacterium]